MKQLSATLAVVLCVSISARAGQLFDDYLNHVRIGPGVEPGTAAVEVSTESPVGQTFTVSKSVGEIYRIGLRPVYETWAAGETITLTLYESTRRGKQLASYSIEEATSRVQAIHNTQDRVVYWHLRVPTEGRTSFFFEISVAGGDGSVSLKGAAAANRGGNLSYVVHIKPVPDRQANLKAFFAERLDVDRPELAAVKRAVEAEDWEKAIAEAAMHFHNRHEVWADYAAVLQEKPRLDADTELADLIMNNQLRHVETKQPVSWRPQDYWIPEWKTERAQPKHGAEPSLYTWHIDRFLAAAYSNTGRPEYARRCIDLRMQFILDNPNPKLVDVPWYFELWNDRTAAARAPGHGLLPYVRLYNYDGWTNDERLIFFSFLEDNARWDYRADSGANWGAEAAKACYEFGLKFPEWRMSPEYVRWGTNRLAEIVLADVRGDGTSTEAAIKYHAMVARRLKGMLQDHVDGHIKLEEPILSRLMKTVEGMYEHMAHTLMPNSFVVMCGDSFYENYAYKTTLDISDLLDARRTLGSFARSKDPLSRHIRARIASMPPAVQAGFADLLKTIDSYDGTGEPSDELKRALVALLNKLIAPGIANPNEPENQQVTEEQAWLYDAQAFAGISLREQTLGLLALRPRSAQRELLSRLLIEDAWGDQVRRGYESGELHSAAKLVNRPDFTWIASQGMAGKPPAQASTIFPAAGYFIMRSDFGPNAASGPGASPAPAYRDARQLFIHNGNWFGSHGHWDLTSVNLYAFGRPLIIDPGQYEHEPPEGIGKYWASSIHSMLVPDGRDCRRQAGPSEWASNQVLDYFDGRHFGYKRGDELDYVRRRIAFIKPDYFVIDDSVKGAMERAWAQCWNFADPDAVAEDNGGLLATTFTTGGNVLVLNQEASRFTVQTADGITAAKGEIPRTRIIRLEHKTSTPRFQTLVYPYNGTVRPKVDWHVEYPEGGKSGDLAYALQVEADGQRDWMAFGQRSEPSSYSGGRHIHAGFALVRLSPTGTPEHFAWTDGKLLTFAGQPLAVSEEWVHALGVTVRGSELIVEAPEPEATLRISADGAKNIVLNGRSVDKPVVKDGMYWPFAAEPRAFVADNRCCFEPVTETDEWEEKANPGAWAGSYIEHETDPGRHENGNYSLDVPQSGKYRVEAFLPRVPVTPSDRVEYRIIGQGKPAAAGGPIVSVRSAGRTHVVTVNQQAMCGWVALGEFTFNAGTLRVNARNATETDGLYFIADAIRLVPLP